MAPRVHTEIEAAEGNEHEQVARDVGSGHLTEPGRSTTTEVE